VPSRWRFCFAGVGVALAGLPSLVVYRDAGGRPETVLPPFRPPDSPGGWPEALRALWPRAGRAARALAGSRFLRPEVIHSPRRLLSYFRAWLSCKTHYLERFTVEEIGGVFTHYTDPRLRRAR
jgi:hypothetical protein